jgi:hypothetical protein
MRWKCRPAKQASSRSYPSRLREDALVTSISVARARLSRAHPLTAGTAARDTQMQNLAYKDESENYHSEPAVWLIGSLAISLGKRPTSIACAFGTIVATEPHLIDPKISGVGKRNFQHETKRLRRRRYSRDADAASVAGNLLTETSLNRRRPTPPSDRRWFRPHRPAPYRHRRSRRA